MFWFGSATTTSDAGRRPRTGTRQPWRTRPNSRATLASWSAINGKVTVQSRSSSVAWIHFSWFVCVLQLWP